MAVNPSIALEAGRGVPQFDLAKAVGPALNIADLMQKLQYQPALLQQTLASQRASQLGTETQTAGQAMLNEQTARENAARVRLAQIAQKNSKVNPTSKKIELDHLAIGNQAASEGMDPGIVFGYLDKAATTAQAKLKTDADKSDFARSILGTANNVLRVQTDPVQASAIAKNSLDVLAKAVGPEAAKTYAGQFWNIPETPSANPMEAGQHLINQSRLNAQASITPQQAVSNVQAQEQITQAGAASVTGPGARDPKSPASRQAQNDYLAANPNADPLQVRKLTASDIQHLTGMSGIVAGNITPPGVRGAAAAAATGLATEADFYDRLAAAADKVKGKFPELTPFNYAANKLNQFVTSDPNANEYYALLRQAQEKGLPLATYSSRESFSQYAKNQAKQLRTQASTQGKLAASPTLTAVPGTPTNPAQAKPAPPPPKKGTVEVFPNGKTGVFKGNVPPGDDWRKAKYWEIK